VSVVAGGTVEVSGAYVEVVAVVAVSTTLPVGNVVVVVPVTAVVLLAAVVVVLIGIFFNLRGRGAGGGVCVIGSVVDVSVAVTVVSVVAVVDVAVCVCAKRLDPTNNRTAANADVRMSRPPSLVARSKVQAASGISSGSSFQHEIQNHIFSSSMWMHPETVFIKTPQTADAITM
jgi:hypothetical protein